MVDAYGIKSKSGDVTISLSVEIDGDIVGNQAKRIKELCQELIDVLTNDEVSGE